MAWVYIIILTAALAGGAYGVRTYNLAIEEAEKSKAKAAEYASAYANLAEGVQRIQQAANTAEELARKRNSRAIAAEKGRDEARRELDKLKEGNKDVKSWADTPVPDVVRLSVGCCSGTATADMPSGANGGPVTNAKP